MNNWKELFYPAIISRGETYFREGRISDFWQENGRIHARINGTEEYETWIDPIILKGDCTCPYAVNGNRCKHMAALYIAINEGAIIYEDIPPVPLLPTERQPYELPWLTAIDELPEDLLRKELMRLADRDDTFKERLSILHAGGLPMGLLDEWKMGLRETINEVTDQRGYIDQEESHMLIWNLTWFINSKLPLLLSLNAVADAFSVLQIAVEATTLRPFYDDQKDLFLELKEFCKENIEKMLPLASEKLTREMEHWLENSFERIPAEGSFPQYEIAFNHPERLLTPFYREVGSNAEWIEVPRDGDIGYFYDPIELHPDYARIEGFINRSARKLANFDVNSKDYAALFEIKKKLLKDRYQILWHSPADLNPSERFD